MTDHLTDQQLTDIAARAEAATAGPWGTYEFGGDTLIEIAAGLEETGTGYRARREICRLEVEPMDNDPQHHEWTAEEDWEQVRADAAFVAAARTDVPVLLAEIRRLQTELNRRVQCGDCGAVGEVTTGEDGRRYLYPSGQIGH
ncbi:hypothetical protein [Streptomyces olivaceus]